MTVKEVGNSIDMLIAQGFGNAEAVVDCAGEDTSEERLRPINGFAKWDEKEHFDNDERPASGKIVVFHPMSHVSPRR
jgi:hypothetical protein